MVCATTAAADSDSKMQRKGGRNGQGARDGSQSLARGRNSEQKNRGYKAFGVRQTGGKVGSGSVAAVEVEGVDSMELLVMAVVAALRWLHRRKQEGCSRGRWFGLTRGGTQPTPAIDRGGETAAGV
jgi:hypothetical protein